MKKTIACLMAAVMICALFTACGNQPVSEGATSSAEGTNTPKLQIVATIFPQYDWLRQILGEKAESAELTLLLDDGVDLHSYQPTADDIIKVSTCDLFIYTGGESDAWVEDVLKTATNDNMVVINLLEVLGDAVKEEEVVEGMEHDHDHAHAEEIDPDNIGDRPLSYYSGGWATIENALNSGAMDEYVAHNAEENETDFGSQMALYQSRWQSDYPAFEITEKGLIIDGTAVSYQYVGYEVVEGDESITVWYGYEAEDTMGIAPKYIALNDHTAEIIDHHEEHDENHEEEHEELSHFHMRYGDDSLTALVEMEGWAPTYFLSSMTNDEVAEAMSGHSHSGEEAELDEHVWLSLRHAQTLSRHIADQLAALDPSNADIYAANLTAYNNELSKLDSDYQQAVTNAEVKTLLFADRFPFRYLADDYGLSYYAAFSGCSAETEASFETIVFLADKVNELSLENIMVIESSDQSIARTVMQSTDAGDQQILVLDSIQSITSADIASGTTYLSLMQNNLEVLKNALS